MIALKNLSTLSWALLLSLAAHAFILTIRFVDPERFQMAFQDTPLQVILVNTRSNEKPDRPQAIAQVSLAGGGEHDKGIQSSPLMRSPREQMGDESEGAAEQIEQLIARQKLLLEQAKSELLTFAQQPVTKDNHPSEQSTSESKRKMMQDKIAEIERRINEQNSRPKKRFVSPSTRESIFATYYDEVRHKIEDKGTQNFPELAGRKLYGELLMSITVDQEGRIMELHVEQSSGSRELDKMATAIVNNSGPFKVFPAQLRAQAQLLVFVARFNFSKNHMLEAKLAQP